jgi:hypothetical protein
MFAAGAWYRKGGGCCCYRGLLLPFCSWNAATASLDGVYGVAL